jgi:hypothetical protein
MKHIPSETFDLVMRSLDAQAARLREAAALPKPKATKRRRRTPLWFETPRPTSKVARSRKGK